VGFYLFVADTAGDLSAGNLYTVKWTQTSPKGQGMGEATISWLPMGHASDNDVKALLTNGTKFSDIFEVAAPNGDASCPSGFKSVTNEVNGQECLKLKANMELAASRLETRRYAGYVGGTVEFRKEEGSTFDPATKTLYVSMSEIGNGMEDNHATWDKGGPNHIAVKKNACGGVYAYTLAHDATIGSDYVANAVKGVIAGVVTSYDAASPYANNTCRIEGLANPDNISFVSGYGTLIIGEDSGSGHQNDAVWAYNIANKSLTRIQTTPYGAESTSVYWYPNFNGFGYLKSVVQHPYGESDQDKANNDKTVTRSYDAYIGPFPAMD
jgi:secreted PhoX family phosphatase